MDPSTSSTANNENTKKRSVSSEEEAQEVQNGSKRICPDSSPLPTSFGVLTSRCSEVIWKEHGPQILLQVLKEMEKKQTFAGLYSLPTSPSCYGPDSTPLELAIGVVVNRFIVKEGPTLEHESRQQVSKELNEIAYNQTSSTNIKGRRLANERRRGKKAHAARHWRSRRWAEVVAARILGEKMSIELWKKIVEHAKQCVGYDPTHYRQILQANDCHADSNHNSEVHNSQNQSVETNHFGEAEVEANDSNQNFKTHQQNQNLHEVKGLYIGIILY
uniref:Uncharacterized protein n=1 Tax=Cucumis sativus TaxID=3659 RepID=A0A0A0LWC4_CUCSA